MAFPTYARKEPYTAAGIRRLKCVRCSSQARYQWEVCADGNNWRPLCASCDIELNSLVLRWMGDPQAEKKIRAYRRRAA